MPRFTVVGFANDPEGDEDRRRRQIEQLAAFHKQRFEEVSAEINRWAEQVWPAFSAAADQAVEAMRSFAKSVATIYEDNPALVESLRQIGEDIKNGNAKR